MWCVGVGTESYSTGWTMSQLNIHLGYCFISAALGPYLGTLHPFMLVSAQVMTLHTENNKDWPFICVDLSQAAVLGIASTWNTVYITYICYLHLAFWKKRNFWYMKKAAAYGLSSG